MRKIRILHITNNYPTERFPIFGIFVKEQIESLTLEGVHSDIFFVNGRENGRNEYFSRLIDLRRKLRNNEYDVLHCHHVFSAVLLLLTFRFYKSKRIVSYQNPPEKEGGIFLFAIIKLFFNGVILKNSKSKKKKLFYLPNGTDTNFFKEYSRKESIEKLNLDDNKNYIIFMDSYKKRAQKRVDRFDKVIGILLKTDNPHGIVPIKLTNTHRSLIPYYLSASSVHLITSDFEGSPNSVKECMACNTPVVSTPVGNVQDLIGDVDGCYISNAFDCEELAGLVIKALTHKHFVGRQKLMDKKLDMKSVAGKLSIIYKSLQ
jgi:teichuronic acid biosynthesis glycosyltransferase TuaC